MLKFSDTNAFKDQLLEPPCRNGFTLSELLMALTIVGVIAVLTVPVMMNNIHNKMFATQVKNMAAIIEQLAQDQLIVHRTRDLSDTDFWDSEKLLTDKYFAIAKTCTEETSLKDCWKTSATGKDKITYKTVNGTTNNITSGRTVILKNGVMLKHKIFTSNGKQYARFVIDINGNGKPNITGRDFFGFYVNSKGHIESYPLNEPNYKYSDKINNCKTANTPYYCYSALVDNAWKMDY